MSRRTLGLGGVFASNRVGSKQTKGIIHLVLTRCTQEGLYKGVFYEIKGEVTKRSDCLRILIFTC